MVEDLKTRLRDMDDRPIERLIKLCDGDSSQPRESTPDSHFGVGYSTPEEAAKSEDFTYSDGLNRRPSTIPNDSAGIHLAIAVDCDLDLGTLPQLGEVPHSLEGNDSGADDIPPVC